ncbi:hypothetical protein [Methylobacterium brachythecii]|uniref:PAS domain-containing protein n=2 Tax=Methylobacterium brachythecii TaxID=1176177 RepID=A0A7W6AF79_9HYPH|nr:hypothetical protein [Methylobacterium brachythecii]MBB3901618.1 PAS domain-containing protein [Methylobacterium brachythecii]
MFLLRRFPSLVRSIDRLLLTLRIDHLTASAKYWQASKLPTHSVASCSHAMNQPCEVDVSPNDAAGSGRLGNGRHMFDIENRSAPPIAKSDVLATHRVGTWQWDIVDDRVTCDVTNAGLLGLTQEEAKRGVRLERVMQAVHPDDRELFRTTTAPARQVAGTVDLVIRTAPAPGVIRHVNVRGRYEPDEYGVMARGYGLLIDLTSAPSVAAGTARAVPSASDDPVQLSAGLGPSDGRRQLHVPASYAARHGPA